MSKAFKKAKSFAHPFSPPVKSLGTVANKRRLCQAARKMISCRTPKLKPVAKLGPRVAAQCMKLSNPPAKFISGPEDCGQDYAYAPPNYTYNNGTVCRLPKERCFVATGRANQPIQPFLQIIKTGSPGAINNGFHQLLYDYDTQNSVSVWPNRDPIEEEGGLNLYNAFQNNPVNNIDYNGKVTVVEGVAMLVVVTVLSAVIVDVGIHLQKYAKHTAEKSIIADTYNETGECRGLETRQAVATIKQEPQDVLTQGLSLDVSAIKMYWWTHGGQIQVMVYAIAEVTDKSTGQSKEGRKLVDQFSYPIPAGWCCKP